MGVIKKIRAPIDKALDWLINWIVTMAKKIGKFAADKASAVLDWWKEKLGFTNKAGETHTLQFIGTGDSAKLGIATDLMPVRQYLDSHPMKGSPDWNTANSVFSKAMQVIYSPAPKDADEKKKRAEIKQELAKVSEAFAKLGGSTPDDKDYGQSTVPTYTENPARVDVLVDKPAAGGSRTGPFPTTTSPYMEIYERGLTNKNRVIDIWVQMHIISEKLGGSGIEAQNLIPAPNSVNSGPFRQFELKTASLLTTKSDGGIRKSCLGRGDSQWDQDSPNRDQGSCRPLFLERQEGQ